MANQLFDPGREGFGLGEIDWDTAVIKVSLVRGYTFSAAHKFVSDVTGAGGTLVATSAALASKTGTNGVLDAADTVFTSVAAGAAIPCYIIYQSSAVTGGADVAASAQRLISYHDGLQLVTVAAVTATSGTSLVVDPLLAGVACGVTLTRVSGTGPTTIVTSATAAAAARTMTVSALSGASVVNDVYSVAISGNGLPITPDGNNISLTFDNGASKIIKI